MENISKQKNKKIKILEKTAIGLAIFLVGCYAGRKLANKALNKLLMEKYDF